MHSVACFSDTYLGSYQIHVCLCCFKCNVLRLIRCQTFAYGVLYLFRNERKIETLKNEYEAKGSERDVDKNGIVSLEELEEVKDKHSKELEEIKVHIFGGSFKLAYF